MARKLKDEMLFGHTLSPQLDSGTGSSQVMVFVRINSCFFVVSCVFLFFFCIKTRSLLGVFEEDTAAISNYCTQLYEAMQRIYDAQVHTHTRLTQVVCLLVSVVICSFRMN